MSSNYSLSVLGCLGELNSLKVTNSSKVTLFKIDSYNYGLILYSINTSRVSFLKLSVNVMYSEKCSSNISTEVSGIEPFKIHLLNIFCLPFSILDVVCTKENIWAIGKEYIIDIKPYAESALNKVNFFKNDDYMDVDEAQEFQLNTYELIINVHQFEKYNFHANDIFIACDAIDNSIAVCNINPETNMWQLRLITFSKMTTLCAKPVPVVDFPLSTQESPKSDVKVLTNPLVVFLQNGDPQWHILKEIFKINCSSANAICMIGHPDGNLLCKFFDYSNKFHSSVEPAATLYDIKQPIIGLHFLEKLGKLEGCKILIIIGALCQITMLSSKKLPSFTTSPGKKFWIFTTHLKSSVTYSAVINDCLIYFSNEGTLWTLDLSKLIADQKMNLDSKPCEMSGVKELIIINEREGFMLLRTELGNMYFAVCQKELDSNLSNSSTLPSLMNECLQQSITMQRLLYTKSLQSKLFSAISTLVSLKFTGNITVEPITFSISKVNLQPKKYMLVINLQSLDKLHLDFDVCHVNASVSTYFQNDYTLVSKTVPYDTAYPVMCLELTDTNLQPPFVSIFPLLVEVGIILQLPDEWNLIDCFKLVSTCLPLYFQIQTFTVHELHLLENSALYQPQSFNHDEANLSLNVIKRLAVERPVSNLLKVENKEEFVFPLSSNFCLTASTVEEMMKCNGDSDPCEYIRRLLLSCPNDKYKDGNVASNKSPINISVNKKKNILLVSIAANSFVSLLDSRMAVMNLLFTAQKKCITSSSAYVNIPGSLHQKCEDMSKILLDIYGHDVESNEVFHTILQSYQELRRNVSEKLPIL